MLSSLYIMTQFESFTYLVTSVRVNPNLYDILTMCLNLSLIIVSQYFSIKLSLKKTNLTKKQFAKIEKEFIHLTLKNSELKKENNKCDFPVIVLQNLVFAIKSIVVLISSFIEGVNVYAYCVVSIGLCLLMLKLYYKNPNYHFEIIFYKFSNAIEILICVLVLAIKANYELVNENIVDYVLTSLIVAFILLELLAIGFFWIRVLFFSKESKENAKKVLTISNREVEAKKASNKIKIRPENSKKFSKISPNSKKAKLKKVHRGKNKMRSFQQQLRKNNYTNVGSERELIQSTNRSTL